MVGKGHRALWRRLVDPGWAHLPSEFGFRVCIFGFWVCIVGFRVSGPGVGFYVLCIEF